MSFLLLLLRLPLLPPVAGLFAPDKSSEEWPLEIRRSLFLQRVTGDMLLTKTICRDEHQPMTLTIPSSLSRAFNEIRIFLNFTST